MEPYRVEETANRGAKQTSTQTGRHATKQANSERLNIQAATQPDTPTDHSFYTNVP